MNRFYIFNAGCIRRCVDCIRIKNYLEKNGWRNANTPKKADMLIISTCGVVEKNEESSLEAVTKAVQLKKKSSNVVITGCLSKINPGSLKKLGNFYYVPNGELDKMDEIVNPKVKMSDMQYPDSVKDGGALTDYLIARSFNRRSNFYKRLFYKFSMNNLFLKTSVIGWKGISGLQNVIGKKDAIKIQPYFNIKIADGCMSICTYCATRFATKSLKSRPVSDILNDFNKGLCRGYKIFQLLSEDSGCYGLDSGSSITELLCEIFSVKGDYKIVLIDFNPWWLIQQRKELIPLLAKNHNRVKEIFIPFQSGSDRILELMKREYRHEELLSVLNEMREKAPDIALRTSALVGFPGETEEDFGSTCRIIEEIDFTEVAINRYEDRPQTLSSQMANKLPQEIIEERANFLVKNLNCKMLS